jgi:inosine-uridine nucleoside N-ribohydrolase
MTTYLWIDCDPGHDDAFALILACHGSNPAVIVAGVSTVCGNQTVDKTTNNALRILHLIDRDDVQVHRGADKPLVRSKKNCPEIHGDSGLDGPDIPQPNRDANPIKPIVAMASAFERILQIPSAKIILCSTGALTNVALFSSVYPELCSRIELAFMGGALGKGNTGPTAEFNIQCDPEAARVVLEFCEWKRITMVPLEITHTALVTPEVRRRIARGLHYKASPGRSNTRTPPTEDPVAEDSKPTTRFREICVSLLMFFGDTYTKVFGFEYPPLHDPCAVFFAIHPEKCKTRKMRIDVECSGSLTAGTTVVDWYRRSPEKPLNVDVVVDMDVAGFWETMCVAVDNASAACPLK